ncbi:MAG TPA: ATP-dependent protease [Candidatus Aminicenantes bacterium]|nr:ATP-dependent protease [Candidatus Aminicenantes bacterium]
MTKAKKNDKQHVELKPEELRWQCDPGTLKFKTTSDLKSCQEIIGQDRALSALRMAFDIESQGYNVFVTGKVGTGRKTSVRRLIRESERLKRIPDDKLYVNDFRNHDTPRLLRLPASQGRAFKGEMDELIEILVKQIPELFESEGYTESRKALLNEVTKQQKKLLADLEKTVSEKGFALVQIQVGGMTRPVVVPMVDGKPANTDKLRALVNEGKMTEKKFQAIEKTQEKLSNELEDVFKKLAVLEKETARRLKEMDHEFAKPVVHGNISEIRERHPQEKVAQYLDEVTESIMDQLNLFRKAQAAEKEQGVPLPRPGSPDDPFLVYRVNLLVDNSKTPQAPVIYETSPTYSNLFGSVEFSADGSGGSRTDFTRIKAGSLLKADGGFLIVEALDLLTEPGVWPAFKRILRNRRLEIQNYSPIYLLTVSGLKPEPIRIDVKVALVGDTHLYQLLFERDPEFKKIFKLRADFDSVMDLNQKSMLDYAGFVNRIANNEDLLAMKNSGVARVLEHGVKLSGNRKKLSTRFNDIADIIREADYWARKTGRKHIFGADVDKAILEKRDRSRLIETKIQEMIEDGSLMIDTTGSVVGQVNGLSVFNLGDAMFGKPSRITAQVAVGSEGIVNIEREAELSGSLHDKGVLIISGFMRARFAHDKPLAVTASLCFEQSYGGVDGDSASSAEIYALMSALSGVPISQAIAVTGSVNQRGEIQPIGGVNEKIEGFFDVCRARKLTGRQGVMIPHQNTDDLMLRQDLVEAVRKGKFHIWPVRNVDEGMQILMGIPAGSRDKQGAYPEGTINHRVNQRLREFAESGRHYSSGDQ